jgi:hypothetical protein
LPFIDHLPVIEDEETAHIRSLEEIACRAMALNIVAVKGGCLEQVRVLEIIERYNLVEQAFTPKEREFVFNESPSEQDLITFTWRYDTKLTLFISLISYYLSVSGSEDNSRGDEPNYSIEYSIRDYLTNSDKGMAVALKRARLK